MQQKDKNSPKNQLSDEIDSPKDRKELQKETFFVDVPEVHDIAGQEDFIPAPAGELADTTLSSSDEEGEDIFEDNIDREIIKSDESNVSQTEKDDLRRAADDMPGDDENLREAALDNTDEDGTPLNEESFKNNITGSDLDIPGAQLDDADENIGEEDEENNDYSLGADNDEIPRDDF